MNPMLQSNAERVECRIVEACERSGRRREDVRVIAVTKYVSTEGTTAAVEAGFHHIGENRWQDAREKWHALQGNKEVYWHFIGHLQTNKVKDVLGRFWSIHSLDRLSLAEEIQKRAKRLDIVVPCFVQLNVSGEETKYGLPPEELPMLLERLNDLDSIDVIGLMTMAPHEDDPEQTRPVFRRLRELRDEANLKQLYKKPIAHLSMGMSNDFEVAIEEGATWIRLGSVLVGKDGI